MATERVGLEYFNKITVIDFEFCQPPGERPQPHCVVAHELITGQTERMWLGASTVPDRPPYACGKHELVVAYNAVAEMTCHLALGWSLPIRVLDLYIEFLGMVNGLLVEHGRGLLGACRHFGLTTIVAEEKASMRELAIRGGPFSADERDALITYCEGDVRATAALFVAMKDRIDLPRAVVRGRYTAAAARMEFAGVPIDVPALNFLREHWDYLKQGLVSRVDRNFGVYDGLTFKQDRFARWLVDHNIPRPTTERGNLKLDGDTFKAMARAYPVLEPLRQVRASMARLRLQSIQIGGDGRTGASLQYFQAKTSRNQPSNTKFIFGPHTWLRGLILPPPGHAIAYVDWSAQEFAIAGVLSGDENMVGAYVSGDPCLVLVAARLAMGQTRYGRLDVASDQRDFRNEALEEAADGLAYAACALMRGRRSSEGADD